MVAVSLKAELVRWLRVILKREVYRAKESMKFVPKPKSKEQVSALRSDCNLSSRLYIAV